MNIVKPLTLGCLNRPYSVAGKHFLSIGALGFFRLGENCERFLMETVQWKQVMKCLPAGQPLDPAMPKGASEFLVAGNAQPCGDEVLSEMKVTAELGALSKTLAVYGDREWYYGPLGALHISAAQVIGKIPLSYANAYGDKSYAKNPEGKGFYKNRFAWMAGRNKGVMPNLEYPDKPIHNHYSSSPPAALSAQRVQDSFDSNKAGTYDKKWLNHYFPGFPEDLDFTLFNQAAPDQRKKGYWQGKEQYRLTGMHPSLSAISGELPDFCVKSLVHQVWKGAETQTLVALDADTVWFFPEFKLGLVIYRGSKEIFDSDALDVRSLLLAYENPGEKKTESHYSQTLVKRLDRKNNPAEVLNEATLVPAQVEAKPEGDSGLASMDRQQALTSFIEEKVELPEEFQQAALMSDADLKKEKAAQNTDQPIKIPELLSKKLSLEDIASGGLDLSGALTELKDASEKLKQEKEEELEQGKKKIAETFDTLDNNNPVSSEEDQYEMACDRGKFLPIDLYPQQGEWTSDQKELIQLSEQSAEAHDAEKLKDQLKQLNALQRQAKAKQLSIPDDDTPLSMKSGKKLGHWLSQQVLAGQPVAGRELQYIVVSDIDFSGLDLTEADFQGACFNRCRFNACNLSNTNFLGASFVACDFSNAHLDMTNLSQISGEKMDFKNALFKSALLAEAKISHSDFSGAQMEKVVAKESILTGNNFSTCDISKSVFQDAKLTDTDWTGCVIHKAVFIGCGLEKADFSKAGITRTVFISANADQSKWDHATVERSFYGSSTSLKNSSWIEAQFKTCGMRGSDLTQASMKKATFYQCDFSQALMEKATLKEAVLCRSLFLDANMQGADCENADFYQAICRKTNFNHANLSFANLVQADRVGIQVKNTALKGMVEQVS